MWDDIVTGLVTQFPILAAIAVIVWWVLRWTTERQEAERKRDEARTERLLAEKDARIADRDQQVLELKAEVAELKGKLSRSRRKGKRKPTGKNP